MRVYDFGPNFYPMTRPLGVSGFGDDPSVNGAAAPVPWWQPLATGFGNLALSVGRTFVPAVIQSELTGQPPSFIQTPTGTVPVTGQQASAIAQESAMKTWLPVIAIGGGLLALVLLTNRRRR